MRLENIVALEGQLKKEGLSPGVFWIFAKEEFDQKQAAQKILQKVEGDITTFSADKLRADELQAELDTIPFFYPNFAVHITQAENLKSSVRKCLELYFKSPNQQLILLLSGTQAAAKFALAKAAESIGTILYLAEPKPWEKERMLNQWLQEQCKKEGKRISVASAQRLQQQCGRAKEHLQQELEKLFCYVGDAVEIYDSDIDAVCAQVHEETIWELGDAILRGQGGKALSVASSMLTDGVALPALIAQIRSQLQTNFRICSILNQGGSGLDVMKEFPYLKGKLLDMRCNLAQAYGLKRFHRALITSMEVELKFKNSVGTADTLLPLLIAKVSR